MIIQTLLLCAAGAFPTLDVESTMTAPAFHTPGSAFTVEVVYTTAEAGADLEVWRYTPAALEVNGAPLGARPEDAPKISLPPNSSITLRLDVGSMLPSDGFELGLAGSEVKRPVGVFKVAPEGLDFMEMPVEDLTKYRVLIQTNQGDMLAEFMPDKAPNHVRNFLDLSYSGFYDGILFHRVGAGFMIQGGCPNTKTDRRNEWGTGRGPRMLDAEFNDVKHERGILSMARSNSPNSASSQFFVMHARNPGLDNQYSVFGRLVSGLETLDAIANAPGTRIDGATVRPTEPQRIEKAMVLLAN